MADFNKGKRVKKGIGMAALMQGSAIPEIDMASAYMKMNDDGSFNLLVGATDLGTGLTPCSPKLPLKFLTHR